MIISQSWDTHFRPEQHVLLMNHTKWKQGAFKWVENTQIEEKSFVYTIG